MYKLKQPLGKKSRKKVHLRFENIKGDEWYIDDDKNIQKLLQIRLLDFLLSLITGYGIQVLQNNKIYRPACKCNKKSLTNSFQAFCLLSRKS